jgi:hypothetical protein
MEGPVGTKHAILGYLAGHPNAKGTLQSITEWWVLEQQIDRCVKEVECVLTELVDDGFVIRRRRTNGPTLYEVNRQRLGEIKKLLVEERSRTTS